MSYPDLNEAAWTLVDYVVFVTHNSDGDELEGCRICDPDRPFTHRDECPMPALIRALMEDSKPKPHRRAAKPSRETEPSER